MSAVETLHIGLLEIENRRLKARVEELEKENRQLQLTIEHASDDVADMLRSQAAEFEVKLDGMHKRLNDAFKETNKLLEEVRKLAEQNGTNPPRR